MAITISPPLENVSLHGVDIDDMLQKFDLLETDIQNHRLNLDEQMSQRDKIITDNTLKIREKNNGTILIVGCTHYDGIVSRLQTQQCSEDFIFVYSKSSYYLDASYVEQLALKNHNGSICVNTVIIDQPKDIGTLHTNGTEIRK